MISGSGRVPPRPVVRLAVDPVTGTVAVNGRVVPLVAGSDPYVAGVHEVARTVAQPLGRAVRCVGEDPDGLVEFVVAPDGASSDVVDVSPPRAPEAPSVRRAVAPRVARRIAGTTGPSKGSGRSARGASYDSTGRPASGLAGLGGRLKLGLTAGLIAVVGATVGAVWSTSGLVDTASEDTSSTGSTSRTSGEPAGRDDDCGLRDFLERLFATASSSSNDEQLCDADAGSDAGGDAR